MAITLNTVAQLLQSVKGTTFARIEYATSVKPAAAHKHRQIRKHTVANVQLFSGLKDLEVYKRQVERSAGVQDFVVSDTWFEHTATFSVVAHKVSGAHYLLAIFNSARSTYTIDGVAATEADVAALLTPSAAAALQNQGQPTHNKTNDVHHSIVCRTIALKNVISIQANQQVIC